MTSIIKFTPISGGLDPKQSAINTPHAYILEVDQFTFLLDCGWDPMFSIEVANELKKHISRIDAVLLSYPDNLHLGMLPYAVGKLGLQCPIFATVPVYKMGQMFLYDCYQSRHNTEDFDLFSLDEVDKTFEMITQLKYNQTFRLKGKGEGIAITPLPAGHMIGGSLWKIVKEGEEDIIYAVDFNHKKEQHLNSCDFERIQRPSLFITDAYNATYKQLKRRNRDEQLMNTILQTLRSSGNVLICVDTAGRVLELAHMIDHLWQLPESGLLAYSLALLNNVSYNVMEFAKSQIEWMSEKLMRNFEGKRSNPFQFRNLKLCHSMSEVGKVPSPKVVLASMPDMEAGFSRDLFLQWSTNPKNTIILTSKSSEGTLAHDLIQNGSDRLVKLEVKKRVKLTGQELEEFRRKEKETNEKQKQMELNLMEEDSSSDEEMDTTVGSSANKIKRHDIILRPDQEEIKSHQVGFFKSNKNKFPMFPYHEERVKYDEYGEIIKPEEWMDAAADNNPANNPIIEAPADETAEDYTEIPTKCVRSMQALHLKAQILYIDFEGRSDGDSIVKVMQHVKPRRTVIVRGSEKNCNSLAEFCRQIIKNDKNSSSSTNKVFIAKNGETVDATTESFIYQIKFPESLIGSLQFGKGKDGWLAWVDGTISYKSNEIEDLKATDENDKKSVIPTLLPIENEEEKPPHNTVFVNELKLSDFKLVLTKHGIPSEFQGGVLFCGSGGVALRRHDSGRVTIEGTLCEEYYQVRELLYAQYAIL